MKSEDFRTQVLSIASEVSLAAKTILDILVEKMEGRTSGSFFQFAETKILSFAQFSKLHQFVDECMRQLEKEKIGKAEELSAGFLRRNPGKIVAADAFYKSAARAFQLELEGIKSAALPKQAAIKKAKAASKISFEEESYRQLFLKCIKELAEWLTHMHIFPVIAVYELVKKFKNEAKILEAGFQNAAEFFDAIDELEYCLYAVAVPLFASLEKIEHGEFDELKGKFIGVMKSRN